MKSNVVQLRTTSQAKTKQQLKRISRNQFRDTIQTELRALYFGKTKMQQIAADTGLCVTTVSRFINGDTKEPRASTVFKLLEYLGYEIFAER